ncbi:MAG: S8 family serine peptidase [Patescibacteria group bacterium]
MRKSLSLILLTAIIFPILPAVADEGTVVPAEAVATTTIAAAVEDTSTTPVVAADTPVAPSPAIDIAPVDEMPGPTEELLVKFRDSVDIDTKAGSSTASALATQAGGVISDVLSGANSAVVSVPAGSLTDAADMLEANPSVEYAEPNYDRGAFSIPTNDTFRDRLWALENTGQSVNGTTGTTGDDIDALGAWNLSLGTSTIVAVIDSGVLYTHPDLASDMWDGTSCLDENGSALGNCLHGYDFADSDKDPLPVATSTSFAHGTHVAGTIAAARNNGTGIIGVAPSAKIMAVRFAFDTASEVKAIDFARENGAKIINASYGGTTFSQEEHDAIQRFTDQGGIFVAAAGNSSGNSDTTPIYPAAYDLPGIISVAATDQNDTLASFSNYGSTTIDLGAPGVNIASTYTDASSSAIYAFADGTSMAAPHVAGVAALIESLYASSTASQVKDDILVSGDADSVLSGKTVSGKRLNALRALQAAGGADFVPPVITLTGSANISLTVGNTYTEFGATATDNVDATTTVVVGGDTVNTSSAGTYHVTYDATDLAGNHAAQVVRTVTVSNPVVSSSGGGGGGGGGGGSRSSSSRRKSGTSSSTITKVPSPAVSVNLARPALTTPGTVPPAPSIPAAPAFIYTRLLTVGSTGPDVTALQQALTRAGAYTGPITGYFGLLTQAGVRAYQTAHALPPVGIVGPMTRALLNQGI